MYLKFALEGGVNREPLILFLKSKKSMEHLLNLFGSLHSQEEQIELYKCLFFALLLEIYESELTLQTLVELVLKSQPPLTFSQEESFIKLRE